MARVTAEPRQDAEIGLLAGIRENFRFLVLEVTKQLEDTRRVLADPRPEVTQKIGARDDYVDNLKSIIENKCFRIIADEDPGKRTVDLLRAVNVCTNNLERIADFAVNIVGQLRYLQDPAVVEQFGPDPFFDEVLAALATVEDALFSRDMNRALVICRTEFRVDQLYADVFRAIMDALRGGAPPEEHVTTLFIYRYLERMADALLNVGEAVIFAAVGEKLKVSHYQALEQTLAGADVDVDISDLDYEGIWASRSGAQIGALQAHGDATARRVLFKEGQAAKVQGEKEALERWERLLPGLPPKVFGFHTHGDKASLLLEYLEGETFQHLVLDADAGALRDALRLVVETMSTVWSRTRDPRPTRPRFLDQLVRRLDDVYKVHPEFRGPRTQLWGLEDRAFEDLLRACEPIDRTLESSFSVLIHGDFNTDNIIVDTARGELHLIDLHRSTIADYVQDASVFLLSNFRMPIFERGPRRRLEAVNREFLHFVREFAHHHEDTTVDVRLALGLARSFTTSTRFELHEDFAQAMFKRARYLLERVAEHAGRPWAEFRLNEDVLSL
jgi:phosphate uptake regulator/aminoglycoside phosphotransferase